jgi:hypothetical protein
LRDRSPVVRHLIDDVLPAGDFQAHSSLSEKCANFVRNPGP